MRTVLQRVKNASVLVEGNEIAKINTGFLCFLGVHKDDQVEQCRELANKIAHLRVFEDNNGKMNLSIIQTKGEILVVSQFTLYADCEGGNRPSFSKAMEAQTAEQLYKQFVQALRDIGIPTQTGKFGAKMDVTLTNDGPVTIILEA